MDSADISVDFELEEQLKVAGEQLLHPSDSIDELLAVLDQVEKLLSKVDQSPQKSMLEALKPSMKALIEDSLLKHSDDDVKVSVASCISEITRITAPDAPYDDDQMRDVFHLIVSSFEDLADKSSRSYNKRASILETVSKVRSCVIMLDLECDALIVEMFEHFLRSVRDYHFDSIYPSMETIMVLVLEESEEITAEMLKPLLASVKKDSEVLPVARKLGEGVLLKSADKLKPCLMQVLKSLGESVDMYTKVVASVCDGTTATFESNDENVSGQQLAKENKLEKGSVDEAQQADESKLTTASSDHTEKVAKIEEADPTLDRSSKSVLSNGVNAVAKEEASVDQESSKKPEEDVNEKHLNKEDTDDSDADKLAKEESQTEQTSKKRGKKTDTVTNSAEPSDSSHVEGDKEIEKDNDVKESENEEDNEVKESENEEDIEVKESDNEEGNQVKESDNEEDNEVKESENEEDNEVKESENEEDNDVKESEDEEEDNDTKESENEEDNDGKESENEEVIPSETERDSDVAQVSSLKAKETKPVSANVSSPSHSNSLPDESCGKTSVRSKKKQVPQKDETASPSKSESPPNETRVKKAGQPKSKGSTQDDSSEETGDLDIKPQKRAGKSAVVVKEVKPPPKDESEDDSEASSDSDAKPVKKSRSKLTKQAGKKVAVRDSDVKKPKQSDAKKSKQSGKKVEKEEESDSDAKPLRRSVKKGEKAKITVEKEEDEDEEKEEEEESDSENKPLKQSAKKSNSKKKVDTKKRGNGKNVTQKDQAKSLSSDDEMEIDSPPKTVTKSAKGEGNSKETPGNSAKRKRTTGKDKVSDAIKYDQSLVGTKVKVWWPEDKMYYEGVVEAFYSSKKKHKVTYVDGEVEVLNLKTQKWEVLEEFSVQDEEPTTEALSEKASPQIHKKKRTKTEPASQEKIKDSSKKLAGVSSSSKSKISASKDNKSKDNSKEKSKEDEETPRSKTASKSKGKTPQTGSKSNANGPTKGKSGSSNVKEPEAVKTSESTKGASKSSKKRKKRS